MAEAERLEEQSKQQESGENTKALRHEYRNLVNERKAQNQLSEKDAAACIDWLDKSQDAQKPQELKERIKHFKNNRVNQSTDSQIAEYREILNAKAKEGIVREESVKERLEWFTKKLSFEERAEILRTKDEKKDDLFSKERADTTKEFKVLFAYFGHLPLYKRFTGLHLKDRKILVHELREKKQLFETSKLPHVVRDAFKTQYADAPLSGLRAAVQAAKQQHDKLKTRFLWLPPLVQEDMREKFKGISLPARAAFLDALEKELTQLEGQYRNKIENKQKPDKTGLNLFSDRPEKTDPNSSAAQYMNWFKNKLTLSGMHAAVSHDDLDKKERKDKRKEMADILAAKPVTERAGLIARFNAAELTGRASLITEQRTGGASSAKTPEKKGVLRSLLRKLVLSGDRDDVNKPMETFAVVSEITERRKRFKLTHHAHHDTGQKAVERGPSDTLEDTQKLQAKTNLESLREQDGGIRVKLDTLESHKDARDQWKRVLKPELGDPNAKLATDLTLRTRSGDEVIDERQYQQGELQRELGDVKDALSPLLQNEARAHGVITDEKETEAALDKADWKQLSDEVIRKAS